MIYLKYFEGLSTINFKTNRVGNEVKILAYKSNQKVGSITFYNLYDDNGWYWLDGLISEEQYEDLFEGINFTIIENLKVDKNFQSNNIGTMLMQEAFKEINKKAKIIILNASPLDNSIDEASLVKFYSKFGFKSYKKQGKNNIMIKRN